MRRLRVFWRGGSLTKKPTRLLVDLQRGAPLQRTAKRWSFVPLAGQSSRASVGEIRVTHFRARNLWAQPGYVNAWHRRRSLGNYILALMPADPVLTVATELPPIPALTAAVQGAVWLWPGGEIEELTIAEARTRAQRSAPIVCHLPLQATRLNCPPFRAFDVLELIKSGRANDTELAGRKNRLD